MFRYICVKIFELGLKSATTWYYCYIIIMIYLSLNASYCNSTDIRVDRNETEEARSAQDINMFIYLSFYSLYIYLFIIYKNEISKQNP